MCELSKKIMNVIRHGCDGGDGGHKQITIMFHIFCPPLSTVVLSSFGAPPPPQNKTSLSIISAQCFVRKRCGWNIFCQRASFQEPCLMAVQNLNCKKEIQGKALGKLTTFALHETALYIILPSRIILIYCTRPATLPVSGER